MQSHRSATSKNEIVVVISAGPGMQNVSGFHEMLNRFFGSISAEVLVTVIVYNGNFRVLAYSASNSELPRFTEESWKCLLGDGSNSGVAIYTACELARTILKRGAKASVFVVRDGFDPYEASELEDARGQIRALKVEGGVFHLAAFVEGDAIRAMEEYRRNLGLLEEEGDSTMLSYCGVNGTPDVAKILMNLLADMVNQTIRGFGKTRQSTGAA
jgi:hypothetical protein